MSKIAEIKQRCVDLLAPLTNQAKLYPYTPYANTEAGVKALMLDPASRVHMWSVIREATPAADLANPSVRDDHKLVFRGWYSLRDDGAASDAEFTEEMEGIRTAFMNNRELRLADGTDPKVFRCDPMQVRSQTTGAFAGLLVHYAEMVMVASVWPIDFVNRP